MAEFVWLRIEKGGGLVEIVMGLFGSSGVVLSHKIFLDFDHTKMLREL
jgi:hypothetical protein